MKLKILITFGVALMLWPGISSAEELVILYSGNTNGYVEPCG